MQSRVWPQRGQTILQRLSYIRSPQRVQKWIQSVGAVVAMR